MLKYFPISATAKKSIINFIVVLACYIGLIWLASFVKAVTGWAPIIGFLIKLIANTIRLYCVVGLVVTIFYYFGIIQE